MVSLPGKERPNSAGKGWLVTFFSVAAAVAFFVAVFLNTMQGVDVQSEKQPSQQHEAAAAVDVAKKNAAAPSVVADPINVGRKKGSSVILQVGANLNPIGPRREDGPCAITVTFEPIVPERIKPHPAILVIPAAVTAGSGSVGGGGLATMYTYNKDGVSSSLSTAAKKSGWNAGGGSIRVVPTVPFRAVLDSLADYPIAFLQTDIQGYDFAAVSSVPDLAKYGIPRIRTEVFRNGIVTYKGAKNDLCWDWWPHMKEQGYIFDGLLTQSSDEGYHNQDELDATCTRLTKKGTTRPETPGLDEVDALWRLPTVPPREAHTDYAYPTNDWPTFSDAEYAACV